MQENKIMRKYVNCKDQQNYKMELQACALWRYWGFGRMNLNY